MRIQNKSVAEWDISVSLAFKADSYVRVKSRSEAPRRDVTYAVGHMPCKFIKLFCYRGSPIAVCHVQAMGIAIPGLRAELQPVADYLLPHVISNLHDPQDTNLQLLRDISRRLSAIVQHLEPELLSQASREMVGHLADLVGPLYPILAQVQKDGSSIVPFTALVSLMHAYAQVFWRQGFQCETCYAFYDLLEVDRSSTTLP